VEEAQIALKYGLNPQQSWAVARAASEGPLPLTVRNGRPSVVNLLDALQGWQLVQAASTTLDIPAAASMKHVSPAGVAIAGAVDEVTLATVGPQAAASEVASSYARARDCDPRSSYGDIAAVSHPVDLATAHLLARVVSDGIIAPGYETGVVEILARKKRGTFLVLEMDPGYVPPTEEVRDVYGIRIMQGRDQMRIDREVLGGDKELPDSLAVDALLGLLAVRHAQSNAVAYVCAGRTIGIGTGQQSRVDCVQLAGEKADRWRLRRHPRLATMQFPSGMATQDRINSVLRLVEGQLTPQESAQFAVWPRPARELTAEEKRAWLARSAPCTLASDAYLPFRDNVDVAARHGVTCIVEGGGSRRSGDIEQACREHGIMLVRTGLRLFYH
jgi:phosphoribosylaminoimidazolecarboxamide formyltransferase / IMP cyclohydrolase